MISDSIQKQIIEAMKAKDTLRVSTFRMLSSELKNATIDKKSDLDEGEELKVVQMEAKKRRDAIEGFEKGGNKQAANNERKELEILQEYLPEQISGDELQKIVDVALNEIGASTMADMGKVIGLVMGKAKGAANGKEVAELVKAKLS